MMELFKNVTTTDATINLLIIHSDIYLIKSMTACNYLPHKLAKEFIIFQYRNFDSITLYTYSYDDSKNKYFSSKKQMRTNANIDLVMSLLIAQIL